MYQLRRAAVGGIVGLLMSGLIIVIVNFATNAGFSISDLGGPIWVLLTGLFIGAGYALLFEPLPNHYAESVATGIVLGIILWFIWAISLQPFITGNGTNWQAVDAVTAVPKLLSYLLIGGTTGAFYSLAYHLFKESFSLLPPGYKPVEITKRVVIIGGGYAGVAAAQALEKELANDKHVSITLVSQNNFLIHTPMLSEVSASAVNAQNISPSLRSFFKNVQVVQSDIENIDVEAQTVHLSPDTRSQKKALPFDHLVLTTGSIPNYFGNQAIENEAFSFKSLDDAILIRNQIIDMFERADLDPDQNRCKQMLTFVVAGGGFAGVELLGGINDFARGISFYYPNVNPEDVRTVLVHSRDRILPELSEELGEFAREKLAERGVEFRLGVRVTGARPGVVEIGDDEIQSNTFVWTAGNQPSPVLRMLGVPLTKRGQLEVNTELQVLNRPNLWAAGDCAQVPDLSTG
ncbi:MAG: FAD-dependent oxidoreductase, partial [Chloroflexota bacterium]